MAFPTALPSFSGFTSSHTLAEDNHAAQHNLEQTEIVAVATKIGTGASTPTSGTVLRGTGASTSAWGQVVLTSDVTGTLPLANGGLGVATLAEFKTTYLSLVYPVGSIYTNAVDATNPTTLLGFGTWSAFGQGRVMVGLNTSDTDFDTAGEEGGAKTHTLTIAEMPAHTHDDAISNAGALGIKSAPDFSTTLNQPGSSTGGGGAHNNLQPYTVVYLWRRTA